MVERRGDSMGGGLYERLLQRLALALGEADSAARWHATSPDELELRGLTPGELALIQAYLADDMQWLRGWHAAAEELARIEQAPVPSTRTPRQPFKIALMKRGKAKSVLKRRQTLCCALCGVACECGRSGGVLPCAACGSRLFRTVATH